MKINKFRGKMTGIKKSILKLTLICGILFGTAGCNDFLDVVPDNIPNLDHVFATKETAENYLATLYTHVPTVSLVSNILWIGADDAWTFYDNHYSYQSPWKIARGDQNTNQPLVNAWDGKELGDTHMNSMFRGIRDCNIFIEEMEKPERVPELDQFTRKRWIAEANYLKAYYHFYLFRMYGPIPITDVNIPVSASPEQIRVKRDPVDKVVDYIAELLDKSAADLPLILPNSVIEEGRVTRGGALTLKAKLLVTAASDLFNGNPDYANFKNKDGENLFSTEKSIKKWEDAAEACKDALDALPGKELYKFTQNNNISDATRYQMNLRGAISEKFNSEVIWTRLTAPSENEFIQIAMLPPRLDYTIQALSSYSSSYISVTLNMVERFYSKNGVPINEDKTWDYGSRYSTATVGDDQGYNVQKGYTTANMNLNRENRFYASLAFDGSLVFMEKCKTDENSWPVQARFGQRNGASGSMYCTETGYYILKLTNWHFIGLETEDRATVGNYWYAWPEFRLADLYLLYAEALNEIDKGDDAIAWLDLVRERSGLKGVKESWKDFSRNPNKPDSQDGLREIIHQEREIELAFEGQRMWDLRRWKKAADFQNNNILGWNVRTSNPIDYYQVTNLYDQKFVTPRDYLWPISNYSLQRNPNLVQNPGWSNN